MDVSTLPCRWQRRQGKENAPNASLNTNQIKATTMIAPMVSWIIFPYCRSWRQNVFASDLNDVGSTM